MKRGKYFDRLLGAVVSVEAPEDGEKRKALAARMGRREHVVIMGEVPAGVEVERASDEEAGAATLTITQGKVKTVVARAFDPAVFPADEIRERYAGTDHKTHTAPEAIEPGEFHAKVIKTATRKAPDGGLFIEGWASTKEVDRDGDIVEPAGFAEAIKYFMENPVLLYMHSMWEPCGKVVEMTIDPEAGFWIKAYISAANDCEHIRTKIREEILKAFSVGFWPLDGKLVGDVWHVTKFELWEVSIVSIPANRQALFSVAKALTFGTDLFGPEVETKVVTKLSDDLVESLRVKWEASFRGLPEGPAVVVLPEIKKTPRELERLKKAASDVRQTLARRKLRRVTEILRGVKREGSTRKG